MTKENQAYEIAAEMIRELVEYLEEKESTETNASDDTVPLD